MSGPKQKVRFSSVAAELDDFVRLWLEVSKHEAQELDDSLVYAKPSVVTIQHQLPLVCLPLLSQQFAYGAPRGPIPQRRRIELEHELTCDAVSQSRWNSAVLDGSLNVRSEDSPAFSQPAADQHSRPSDILQEGGGLRRWGGLHG
jgi:hypothetical protein